MNIDKFHNTELIMYIQDTGITKIKLRKDKLLFGNWCMKGYTYYGDCFILRRYSNLKEAMGNFNLICNMIDFLTEYNN